MRTTLLTFTIVMLASGSAQGYIYHDYRWDAFPVTWYLDDSAETQTGIAIGDIERAIAQGFERWAAAEYGGGCTAIWVQYGGRVSALGISQDNRNVVSFVSDPGYPGPPNSYAITVPYYRDHRLLEVDMVFHVRPDAPFALEPGPSEYDLLGFAMHEMGHFFGLDHTEVPAASMYGTFPAAGDTSWQSLEADDLQGITALYPAACGARCTPGGDECEPGQVCHPQTGRCAEDPKCPPVGPPSRGCAAARGRSDGHGWPPMVVLVALLLATRRVRDR